MQKKIINLLLFIFSVFLLSSCTKFEDNVFTEEDALSSSSDQYILLEEYTAQRCPNCPAAAENAASLKEVFGDNLIVVAVHVGDLAAPVYGYPLDLRSPAGDVYDAHYECSKVGLPKGTVNRLAVNGSAVLQPGDWAATVRRIYDQSPVATMTLKAELATDSSLQIASEVKFIEDYTAGGDINIVTLVVEDSIIGKQTMLGKDPDPNYVHRHVMRACVDADPWGTSFTTSNVAKDFSKTQTYTYSLKGKKWKHKDLYVVSYICDASTKTIIQAVEKHVILK